MLGRIGRSDLVVYVRCVHFAVSWLNGRLAFLAATETVRCVIIEVGIPGRWDDQVAIIAHELQHAAEIAEARWVRSVDDMERYYRRAGTVSRSRPLAFDTEAAVQAGERVRREGLATAPPLGSTAKPAEHAERINRENR